MNIAPVSCKVQTKALYEDKSCKVTLLLFMSSIC